MKNYTNKPKTGALRFGDCWTGIYLTGDNAFAYSTSLRRILKKLEEGTDNATVDLFDKAILEGLAATLEASNEEGWTPELKDTQLLVDYEFCLKEHQAQEEEDFVLEIEDFFK